MIEEIKTLPSLFLAENRPYGKADDDQRVIYGFVSDLKIYVPMDSVEAYKSAEGWSIYADAIVGYDF